MGRQEFMKLPFRLTRAQLKVFSALCTEFVVVWVLAILGTRDLFILTTDLVFAIIFLVLAIKAEEESEKHDN